jgi:hypothetical protein
VILLVVLAVLGGVYYRFGRSEPAATPKPLDYVWLIDMESITHVEISLPRESASQNFVKIIQGDNFPWFFDDANHSPVDQNRWSSGIPLLLSGPAADRKINDNASPQELAAFGLTQPKMEIVLLTNQGTMKIDIGNKTPDGQRVYVRAPDSNIVATVDGSWYDIMEGLVKNPPYATPTPTR